MAMYIGRAAVLCTGSATSNSLVAARAMNGGAASVRPTVAPRVAVDCRNFRLSMTSSLFTESSGSTLLPHAFAQHAFEPRYTCIHDDGQGREHEHRHPDQRDVIGLAGIEDRAAEAVLRGDELADDRAGQGEADVHPQHRDDPGQAERNHQLAEHLHPAGPERIE